MKKALTILAAMLSFMPAAQAEGAFDWLQGMGAKSSKEAPADSAKLVTLEPKESEMYPKVSPDGRFFLVNVQGMRQTDRVSRRAAENGDPLNVVTEDVRAQDSIRWQDNEKVRFLSERAMGLGLWERYADGTGVFRRTHELTGIVTQPVSLPDGSIIAASLVHVGKANRNAIKYDEFNNWEPKGFESHIVRIDADGSEKILSKGINPAVSPDGQWIAFTMPIGRSWHLFLVRPDGSDLTQLTDERCVDVQPAWSADGKWIVFTSNRGQVDMRVSYKNNWDIWAIDREGKNLLRLTEDEAQDGAPSVGPNGKVYFHSDRQVSKELQQDRQATSRSGSFHIWSAELPKS